MQNRRLPLIVLGVVAFIILMALSNSLFYTIEATERAIIFYPFGKGLDKDNVIDPVTISGDLFGETAVLSFLVGRFSFFVQRALSHF